MTKPELLLELKSLVSRCETRDMASSPDDIFRRLVYWKLQNIIAVSELTSDSDKCHTCVHFHRIFKHCEMYDEDTGLSFCKRNDGENKDELEDLYQEGVFWI